MKKKLLALITAMCLLVSLCGCTSFGSEDVTDAYRKMNKIYEASRDGKAYTKEELKTLLGNPDYYNDLTDENKVVMWSHGELTGEEALIFGSKVVYWRYDCYKYPDPAKSYKLEITFDKDGNATFIDFNLINEE